MAIFIISTNSERVKEMNDDYEQNRATSWVCLKNAKLNDIALFYFGKPSCSIRFIGIVSSLAEKEDGPFDWNDKEYEYFCDYSPLLKINNPRNLKSLCDETQNLSNWYKGRPYQSRKEIPNDIARELLNLIMRDNPDLDELVNYLEDPNDRDSSQNNTDRVDDFFEAGIKEIVTEYRYRDPQLKKELIKERGSSCEICGFDFFTFYGEIGNGYIEIHHDPPLSQKKENSITQKEDARLVCANCHRILHRNGIDPISVETLKNIVKKYPN